MAAHVPTLLRSDHALKALSLGFLSSSAYSVSYLIVRKLGQGGLHAFEIAFFRAAICFVILVALALVGGGASFRTLRPGVIVLRGVLSATGLMMWFYGLTHLPLAEASTLSLTTVCFATALGAIFLKERITSRKALAVALAMAGAVAIIRPGFAPLQVASLAVLAGAACWGAAACLVRSAARTENPMTIVLWTSMLMSVFTLLPALTVWRTPSTAEMVALSLVGALTAGGMIAWTNAFRYGEATLVTITDFAQLVLGIVLGLAIGEVPGPWSLIGIVLIFCATAAIGWETVTRNARKFGTGIENTRAD